MSCFPSLVAEYGRELTEDGDALDGERILLRDPADEDLETVSARVILKDGFRSRTHILAIPEHVLVLPRERAHCALRLDEILSVRECGGAKLSAVPLSAYVNELLASMRKRIDAPLRTGAGQVVPLFIKNCTLSVWSWMFLVKTLRANSSE